MVGLIYCKIMEYRSFLHMQRYKHVQRTSSEELYQVKKIGVYRIQKKNWREHPDLNQGPLDLQSNALPLSYTPIPCTNNVYFRL